MVVESWGGCGNFLKIKMKFFIFIDFFFYECFVYSMILFDGILVLVKFFLKLKLIFLIFVVVLLIMFIEYFKVFIEICCFGKNK